MTHHPERKKALLVWTQPHERLALFKILSATGLRVDYEISDVTTEHQPQLHEYLLALVDSEALGDQTVPLLRAMAHQPHRPAVLLFTSSRNSADFAELFALDGLTNLIAGSSDLQPQDLIVTVQKIVKNDIFGIEKYLTWGVDCRSFTLRDTKDKEAALHHFEEYVNSIGTQERLSLQAVGVADELITNGMFNAARDASGNPKYSHLPRNTDLQLEEHETVSFCYASDGWLLALSVTDNFGQINEKTVRSCLQRCFLKRSDQIEHKPGGAGIGLYHVFDSVNHLVINVAARQRTELIGILKIAGTYRDFKNYPKSLNIFQRRVADAEER